MGKHYGSQIIAKVLELKAQGLTNREAGSEFGLSLKQVTNLLNRHRRNESKRAAGIELKPKGRPRTRELSREEALELEIKRLEREVALYKSFLQAAGRG